MSFFQKNYLKPLEKDTTAAGLKQIAEVRTPGSALKSREADVGYSEMGFRQERHDRPFSLERNDGPRLASQGMTRPLDLLSAGRPR